MAKRLMDCLSSIGVESLDERMIERITNDSRTCDSSAIYCGEKYQKEAEQKGAFTVEGKYLGSLLKYFYDDPASHYTVIGVTGTSGKTSVTSYLKNALDQLGFRCIRLGTNYNEFEDIKEEASNTTMNVMDNLKVFLQHLGKIDVIIMEVSTHAIEENRIAFISFDTLIYTNISHEHLDYHKTYTHYRCSKFKLRHYLKENGRILIHYDHPELRELIAYERPRIISYGIKGRIQISDICTTLDISTFKVNETVFQTTLIGEVHLMNLLAVIACLMRMGFEASQLSLIVKQIGNAEGRMEKLMHHGRIILIDYAHTPMALKQACSFLKGKAGNLICVFGCGGERDRGKRADMAYYACMYSDIVIVSEDNSRNEDFHQIISDMKLERFRNVQVIEKRADAVCEAFHLSQENDIILLAGKGNEKFLIAKGVKTPYNDKACILSCERG